MQYRLAPEHTFPAAHNDAETGANIIWKYAQKLGVDRDNITLAGDSAGGHGAGHRTTPESCQAMATCTAYADLPDAGRNCQLCEL